MGGVGLRRRLSRVRDALEMVSIHALGMVPANALRILALRAWGAKIETGVSILSRNRGSLCPSVADRGELINGNDSILDARGGLYIGSNVNLSSGVHIWTGQHDWQSPDFAFDSAPVRVGDRVWLSDRVVVLPGVEIGEGAVAAAGAVVVGPVEEYALVGGVPAKVLGDRPRTLTYELCSRHKVWWW